MENKVWRKKFSKKENWFKNRREELEERKDIKEGRRDKEKTSQNNDGNNKEIW